MLTYGFRNVMQEYAAVGDGGGSRFGPPESETNESQPPETNDYGTNTNGKLLLG